MIRLFYLFIIIFCSFFSYAKNIESIYILKISDHPALNKTENSIINYLNNYSNNTIKIKSFCAQGNIVLAKQLSDKIVSEHPDFVIAIATSAASVFVPLNKKLKNPLIYSSVTAPKEAGFTDNNLNFMGVSNYVDSKKFIKFIQKNTKNIQNLGVIYNPSELFSSKIVTELKNNLPSNIKLVPVSISKTTDAVQATNSLIKKVDAILINNDNTALSAINTIASITKKNKIDLYTSDLDTTDIQGVTGALGSDGKSVGKQTAQLIIDYNNNKLESKHQVIKNIIEIYNAK